MIQPVTPQRLKRVATPDEHHTKSVFPPWFPSESSDRLHLAAVVLHAAGAIGAYIMSTYCDVLPANQQARVPALIEGSVHNSSSLIAAGISDAQAFRAGFPMAQDAAFVTHVWNPYILIASFEWITAGFAMCTLRHWMHEVHERVIIWLYCGGTGVVLWYFRHYVFSSTEGSQFAYAMGILLALSYIAAVTTCSMYLEKEKKLDPVPTGPDTMKPPPPIPEDPDALPDIIDVVPPQGAIQVTRRIVVQGRQW